MPSFRLHFSFSIFVTSLSCLFSCFLLHWLQLFPLSGSNLRADPDSVSFLPRLFELAPLKPPGSLMKHALIGGQRSLLQRQSGSMFLLIKMMSANYQRLSFEQKKWSVCMNSSILAVSWAIVLVLVFLKMLPGALQKPRRYMDV